MLSIVKKCLSLIHRIYCRMVEIRDWILLKGSRTIEVGNVFMLFLWSGTYTLQKWLGLDIQSYAAFEKFDKYHWQYMLMIMSVVQAILIPIRSARANVLSGFLLLVSCGIWTFIVTMFANVYVIHTGITTYSLMAIACFAAGSSIMAHNDNKIPQYYSQYCSAKECEVTKGWEDDTRVDDRDATTAPATGVVRDDWGAFGGLGTGEDGQRRISTEYYLYSLWCRLRDGCKRLLARCSKK